MIFNMQRGGMISNMRDKEGVRSQCIVVERELALATLATHRWRNCKTEALFPQTIAHSSQTIASCQRCDLDRDGKLDYQEFRAMIFRSRERKEALLREEQEQASQASAQRTAFLFISMMASSFFSS